MPPDLGEAELEKRLPCTQEAIGLAPSAPTSTISSRLRVTFAFSTFFGEQIENVITFLKH